MFAFSKQDAQTSNDVISGTLYIDSLHAHVLINLGATHTYVSPLFVSQLKVHPKKLNEIISVTTPGNKILESQEYIDGCQVRIAKHDLPIQMILLDMVDFDIIIGMDWLARNYAMMDCRTKVVRFDIARLEYFIF